ncbi:hypothetical protein [Saccharothrix sp.]|nr:hypothetical protein [Saccharothrix sp.]
MPRAARAVQDALQTAHPGAISTQLIIWTCHNGPNQTWQLPA